MQVRNLGGWGAQTASPNPLDSRFRGNDGVESGNDGVKIENNSAIIASLRPLRLRAFASNSLCQHALVKISAAAEMLGTKPDTLRKWERTGELLPTRKTRAGTRYCAVADPPAVKDEGAPTIAYARVSSRDRKADLDRQREVLEAYCAAKGWRT